MGVLGALGVAMSVGVASAQATFPAPGKAFGFNEGLREHSNPNLLVSDTRLDQVLDAAQAAGATHMRWIFNWSRYPQVMQPGQTPDDFQHLPIGSPLVTPDSEVAHLDRLYTAVSSRQMRLNIAINKAPQWTCTGEAWCSTNADDDRFVSRNYLYAMRDIAKAIAERYPAAVIEGPNEPDLMEFQLQPNYTPPEDVIADGQCALAEGVRNANVSGDAPTVLTSGVTGGFGPYLPWLDNYLAAMATRDCYDHINFHLYEGRGTKRSDNASHIADALYKYRQRVAAYQSPGASFWITETGISAAGEYFRDSVGNPVGEPRAAQAFQGWIDTLTAQSDIDGVLVQMLSYNSHNKGSAYEKEFGLLTQDLTQAMPAAPNAIPRFCWLVLKADNDDSRCEGMTLPATAPVAAYFEQTPRLSLDNPGNLWTVPQTFEVEFYARGVPPPTVAITWKSCPVLGACATWSPQLPDASHYQTLGRCHRNRNISAVVTITNSSGPPVTMETNRHFVTTAQTASCTNPPWG